MILEWLTLGGFITFLCGGWALLAFIHLRQRNRMPWPAALFLSLIAGAASLILTLLVSDVAAANITTPWSAATGISFILAFGPATVSHLLWIAKLVAISKNPEQPLSPRDDKRFVATGSPRHNRNVGVQDD